MSAGAPIVELVLVRHAETAWSLSGRHTGRTDVPLTAAGRRQAEALAPLLADRRFARVLCSPLGRAVTTARLAGLREPEPCDELLEWDYGDLEGQTTPDIRRALPGWALWRDGAPGGEAPDEVAARVDRVIAGALDVLAGPPPADVAIVAHGHVLRALAARWLEEPVAFGGRLALSTASVSRLGFEREVRVVREWNRTAGV